jgi:hypothetical protein
MSKPRTGIIRCNKHYYDNEFKELSELLSLTNISVEIQAPVGTHLIKCESKHFDEGDNYPEYTLRLSRKDGNLKLLGVTNSQTNT